MLKQLAINSRRLFLNSGVARNYSQSLYTQGQTVDKKIREYFYFIDHEEMLFLDDARIKNFTSCFKDKHFIRFFFKRLQFNSTNRYQNEFPYISLCGTERNYVRCDDLPIVFTEVTLIDNSKHLDSDPQGIESEYSIAYNHSVNELRIDFQPEKVYMSPQSGRVYHPAESPYGNIGLVRSKLAIEFSKYFEFESGEHESPTHFTWNNTRYTLQNDWLKYIRLPSNRSSL